MTYQTPEQMRHQIIRLVDQLETAAQTQLRTDVAAELQRVAEWAMRNMQEAWPDAPEMAEWRDANSFRAGMRFAARLLTNPNLTS
jgi:hypothetical protein